MNFDEVLTRRTSRCAKPSTARLGGRALGIDLRPYEDRQGRSNGLRRRHPRAMTLLDHLPPMRLAHPDRAVWPSSSAVDSAGRLCVGGIPLTSIADEFGTPVLRHRRGRLPRPNPALPVGIARISRGVCRKVALDHDGGAVGGRGRLGPRRVFGRGELAIALAAGTDPARIVMHGNAKTVDELSDAVTAGVGTVVVDSLTEISHLAGVVRRPQRVLLRVTPDIDVHGHRAVNTGVADQKFGFTLDDGEFGDAVDRISQHRLVTLVGLHCHLGRRSPTRRSTAEPSTGWCRRWQRSAPATV